MDTSKMRQKLLGKFRKEYQKDFADVLKVAAEELVERKVLVLEGASGKPGRKVFKYLEASWVSIEAEEATLAEARRLHAGRRNFE